MEYNQNGLDTGFYDDMGIRILVGDILKSEDDFFVLVCQDQDGHFYGSLVCEIGNSCRNIPYALNKGLGYTKITQ